MKNLIFILIAFSLYGCSNRILKIEIDLSADKYEPGKIYTQMPCYYLKNERINDEIIGYSVKIIEPNIEFKIDTISKTEYYKKRASRGSYYRYEKIELQEWSEFEAAYNFKEISNSEIIDKIGNNLIIKRAIKIITKAQLQVTYFKKEPKNIPKNYFESKCEISFRRYEAGSISRYNLIQEIQEKLNEKGYNLEVTNKMNSETKIALENYQRKNKLPIGNLDFHTLQSLELDNPTLIKKGIIQREIIMPTSNNR